MPLIYRSARDSQYNPNRAADIAADLINSDNVDPLIADAAPDTTNPVADQAEASHVPCIITVSHRQRRAGTGAFRRRSRRKHAAIFPSAG